MATTSKTRPIVTEAPRSTVMQVVVRWAAKSVEKKTRHATKTAGTLPDPLPAGGAEQISAQEGGQVVTLSPTRVAGQEGLRLLSRYRRQLAPLAAMGATHAAGAAAAAADGAAALGVLALTGAGTAGAYAVARQRLGRWGRTYAAIACTASMSWQTLAAAVGPGSVQALLWLGGAALALPWWIRHSEATPDVTAEQEAAAAAAQAEPAVPPEEPETEDWRVTRWAEYLGAKGRALPGSSLSGIVETAYGWTATVDLGRGEHWSKISGVLATIASVYDLPDGRVLTEPIQGQPVHRARLTVLTRNPLEQITRWERPGLDNATGTFPLAVTADGDMLHWRLWWPGAGMCHGLVAGTTGSGKSATLDLILSEAALSDRIIPIIIDGSGGMSVPDWIPHVPYKAVTVEEAIELLERIVAAMDARFALLTRIEWVDKRGRKRKGRNSIDPTPGMPGLLIVIDEAHRLLMDDEHGKRIRRLIEIITQMGRKVAISVVLATQQASVTQLGGSSVIRDMCKGGNVVALRTGERVSGGMVGTVNLPEPLHELPSQWPDGSPTQGLCYVTTARAIRARTLWVEDPYANAVAQTPVKLDDLTKAHLDGTAPRSDRPASAAAADDQPPLDDLIAQVREALDAGTPADPVEIARATGMTWRQAKTALGAIN